MIIGNVAEADKVYYGDGRGGFLREEAIGSSSMSTLAIASGDLNNDGNLDLATALLGVRSNTVVAVSEALAFGAAAIIARQEQLQGLNLASKGNSDVNVTLVGISVSEGTYSSGSECRAPADPVYSVTAWLRIEFPLIVCYTPECIILDPLEAIDHAVRWDPSIWHAWHDTVL